MTPQPDPDSNIIPLDTPPPSAEVALQSAATVDRAALRFADYVQDRLRYAEGPGWFAWDGRRWKADSELEARTLSAESIRRWTEAQFRTRERDSGKALREAMRLENGVASGLALNQAAGDKRLLVSVDDLDADSWTLNVGNGTLDLRTGTLKKHARADMLTKLAAVDFDPDASHPVLDDYLAGLDSAAPGTAAFLARAIGCSLSGDASPESLFLVQGPGGNGKSTLAEAVASMLGDYAVKLPFASFVLSKHAKTGGSASPDLVMLCGTRFAFACEGDQSARLDAGAVKELTGRDRVTARKLYGAPFTFMPTWKLWLVSNFDPRCDADDSGLWRRIVKVEFPPLPPEKRDPRVKEALTHDPAARSALLAWAVRGCIDWQARGRGRDGLGITEDIAGSTDAYRHRQDTLGQWWDALLDDGARLDQYGTATSKEIRDHFERWCCDEGASPVLAQRFSEALKKRGLVKAKGHGGTRKWNGISMP